MSFLSVSKRHIAFCGRNFVYIFTTKIKPPPPQFYNYKFLRNPYTSPQHFVALDLSRYIPESCKAPLDRISPIHVHLSKCDNYLTVADNEKNVYIFEKTDFTWELYTRFESDKRVVKVQLDPHSNHLLLTDRNGDLFISLMNIPDNVPKGCKIIGHSSLLADSVFGYQNTVLLTVDIDNKIRCSRFPDTHEIVYFLDGAPHSKTETLVDVSLFYDDKYILSTTTDGMLTLYFVPTNLIIKAWNIFQIWDETKDKGKPSGFEIRRFRLTETHSGKVYFAMLVLGGVREIPVFEMKTDEKTIRQMGQVHMDSEYCDMGWDNQFLYTFNPEFNGIIRRFNVSTSGVSCDGDFLIPRISEYKHDFDSFLIYQQNQLPLRRRLSAEVLEALSTLELEELEHGHTSAALRKLEKKMPRIVRNSVSRSPTNPLAWVPRPEPSAPAPHVEDAATTASIIAGREILQEIYARLAENEPKPGPSKGR